MADEPKVQLFVSHHSSTLDVALEVEKLLAKHGVSCWLAPRDVEPSESFDTAIKRAIEESCGILLLFCEKSDKSPHVKRELILADSSRKAIIPLRLEDLDPDELAYHLANSQWIDWLEKRDSTIERVAAKAHQLSGNPEKTMVVDDLIAHGGGRAGDGTTDPAPAQPDKKQSLNWTLMVAIAALLVAVFAAWQLWSGSERGTGDTETESLAENPSTDLAEPELAETETPEPAPAETDSDPAEPQPRPSFNCANASFRVEFLICDSVELADLDRALDSAYRSAMRAAGPNRSSLEAEQQNWRVEQRDSCADTACVASTMRERIARLKEISVRGYESPDDLDSLPDTEFDELVPGL